MSNDRWVVWSEEHGGWWKAGGYGYTRSLREAGRFTGKNAKEIEENANRYLKPDELHEVAMRDPLKASGWEQEPCAWSGASRPA